MKRLGSILHSSDIIWTQKLYCCKYCISFSCMYILRYSNTPRPHVYNHIYMGDLVCWDIIGTDVSLNGNATVRSLVRQQKRAISDPHTPEYYVVQIIWWSSIVWCIWISLSDETQFRKRFPIDTPNSTIQFSSRFVKFITIYSISFWRDELRILAATASLE